MLWQKEQNMTRTHLHKEEVDPRCTHVGTIFLAQPAPLNLSFYGFDHRHGSPDLRHRSQAWRAPPQKCRQPATAKGNCLCPNSTTGIAHCRQPHAKMYQGGILWEGRSGAGQGRGHAQQSCSATSRGFWPWQDRFWMGTPAHAQSKIMQKATISVSKLHVHELTNIMKENTI